MTICQTPIASFSRLTGAWYCGLGGRTSGMRTPPWLRSASATGFPYTPIFAAARQWVLTLLEPVMNQLEAECRASGRGEQFDRLKEALIGPGDRPAYAVLAADLGMTEEAARQAASRLRKRYRDLLRAEVSQTLA